ncbi:S-4TM family putative pore-forming effector [Streptomyces sp. NBC_00078]|uniref:S-4TM family putative pore-forming effector n=1 Tax=unclassified Streptomyces TaxID=2593676 RepID=UPI00338DEE90
MLFCLEQNLAWGSRIRLRFAQLMLGVLVLWSAAGVLLTLATGGTMSRLVTGWFVPSLGLPLLCLEMYRTQMTSIQERLRVLGLVAESRGVRAGNCDGSGPSAGQEHMKWLAAGRALGVLLTESAQSPGSEAVNRGDGRSRHPPQERPRPSRGTGRAAARTFYSAVSAVSVTPRYIAPCHKVVAACADMDEQRFQVVTCFSRRAGKTLDHRNDRRPRRRDHRTRNHGCWGTTRS